MIDKNKAIELREAGLSYSEIALELGCSEIWCKKNLKDVVKNSAEKEAIARCVTLAQRPSAVTYCEIASEINTSLGIYANTDKALFDRTMKRFKAGIHKIPGTVIRPYWMTPDNSQHILNDVISEINDLDLRMWEGIQHILHKYRLDDSHVGSLYRVIGGLMYSNHKGNEGQVRSKLSYLSIVAEELALRNGEHPPAQSSSIIEDIEGIDDFLL